MSMDECEVQWSRFNEKLWCNSMRRMGFSEGEKIRERCDERYDKATSQSHVNLY